MAADAILDFIFVQYYGISNMLTYRAIALIVACPTMQQHSLVRHCQVRQCQVLHFQAT